MSENMPTFRTVMRGYDPTEVDRRIAELSYAAAMEQQRAAELQSQVEQLNAAADSARREVENQPPPAEPSYAALGARVGQILTLAEEEAKQLREDTTMSMQASLSANEAAMEQAKAEADRYVSDTRIGIDREAARIIEDAKRTADQLLDDADRQASARRGEAEAVYEQQKAHAAQAAADFEQTLATRRDKAEAEFQHRTSVAEDQLRVAQQHVAALRTQTEQAAAEAARKSAAKIAESEQKADQIVTEAIARADRIRTESERELSAASQRRDSINAQLTNVRQMLATLSGTGPAAASFDDPTPTGPPAAAPAVTAHIDEETGDPVDAESQSQPA